ncbi:MAG: hypothetical protein NT119_10020 [Actinobacteria bacterium]|nr:hypothetical protein [Actinomycetota bacterium]
MIVKLLKKKPNSAVLLWVALCFIAIFKFASISQNRTFQYDEWNFVMNRWQFNPDTFLQPHNSHLSLFPATIYWALFHIVGLNHYGVYQMIGYLSHILVASMFVVLVRTRLGETSAIALGAAILFLGAGAENILWPFQIGSMFSLAGYLLAIYFLESTINKNQLLAMLALMLSLGSAGLGVAAVAAVAIEILISQRVRKSWWVVVAPTTIWLVWYSQYGISDIRSDNFSVALRYVNESFASSLSEIFGLSIGWGFIFEIIFVLTIIYFTYFKKIVTPRLVGLLTLLFVNWSFTALSRAQNWAPASSRYLYFSIPLVFLICVELSKSLPRPQLNVAVVIISIWSITAGWAHFESHASWLRDWSSDVRAELSVLESRRHFVEPDYQPDPIRAPDIITNKYFAALRELKSSPALDMAKLRASSAATRTEVDRVLLETDVLTITQPKESAFFCKTGVSASDFLTLAGTSTAIASPDGDIEIGFRNFSDSPSSVLKTFIPSGSQVTVTISSSLNQDMWIVTSLTPNKRVCIAPDLD